MVCDHQGEYSSQWKAIESIAAKLSINHETLRIWVRRAETDARQRPGLITDERARIKELEKRTPSFAKGSKVGCETASACREAGDMGAGCRIASLVRT